MTHPDHAPDREAALAAALDDLAGRARAGSPPVSTLISRGRRSRHARAAFAGTAAVAGIGVVAALAATGPGYGGTHPAALGAPSGSQTGQASPIALSLAAERTDASPFHYTLTAKSTEPKADGGQVRTSSGEGAFDPSAQRGYAKATGGGVTAETIRIGDTCYAQPVAGASWLIEPCVDDSGSSLASLTENPAADLKQLEADGQATYAGRSGTGSAEVDTWKFTIVRKTQSEPGGATLIGYTATGTATVGVADGHVHAIDYTITPAPNRIVAEAVSDVSITFSDYGVPVHVAAPAGASKGGSGQ